MKFQGAVALFEDTDEFNDTTSVEYTYHPNFIETGIGPPIEENGYERTD